MTKILHKWRRRIIDKQIERQSYLDRRLRQTHSDKINSQTCLYRRMLDRPI